MLYHTFQLNAILLLKIEVLCDQVDIGWEKMKSFGVPLLLCRSLCVFQVL